MLLEGRGINKVFGGRQVLFGIDISVSTGAVTAVVGPSGSGKSTLLGILGGLVRADGGTVTLVDEGIPRKLVRNIVWVPQGSNSLSHRTVLDNAALGGLARGQKRDCAEQRARADLAVVGLDDVVSSRADQLSGGELQRLAFARALGTDAPFIFADEPTGNLDALTTQRILGCLGAISSAGRGVLVATHDQAVLHLADKVLDLTR